MITTRTRIIHSGTEVCDRLEALNTAQPVVHKARATVNFLRFLRSLRAFPKTAPEIYWLDGIHDYSHRLQNLGVYIGSNTGFYDSLRNWRRLIDKSVDEQQNQSPILAPRMPLPSMFRSFVEILPQVWPNRFYISDLLLFCDENFLRAIECGLGYFVVGRRAVVLFPRPRLRFYHERNRRPVLHSTIAPAVEFPKDPDSNQFWLRGVRVPEFVIMHPERITMAHIRAARAPAIRHAMIDQYGLLRYARERQFRPVSEDADLGAVLYVAGGKRESHGFGGVTERRCIVELINSTPEPDGTHRHFARRVPGTMQTAREAVAWTFGLAAEEYHPDVQT